MPRPQPNLSDFDAVRRDGKAVAEVKFAVDAVRTVRAAVMKLSYALGQRPGARAYLVLIDPTITDSRLFAEWQRAESVLRPDVLDRITICLLTEEGRFRGVPEDPPAGVQRWLRNVVKREEAHTPLRARRTDYEFVVLKVLLHQWLLRRAPVTVTWLAHTAGCSYPTVARVLKRLGSLVKRESDRSVSLRYFPREEFSRLLARAEKARSTIRFADHSGRPRAPEAHVRRLDTLSYSSLAIGGVLGARHHYPSLDLVGTPRLDISVHCYRTPLDVGFIEELDPALKREDDPLTPANVAVHAVRHTDSLFVPRDQGLFWADAVECLLDLHEARLPAQAAQFLEALMEVPGQAR